MRKVKLTGLWRRENQYGEYYTGKYEGQLFMLVPNLKREGINPNTGTEYNDADFTLYRLEDGEEGQ